MSKVLDAIARVAGAVAKDVPLLGTAIGIVNAFRDPDDRLNAATATGADVQRAIDELPPEARADALLRLEVLAQENTNNLRAMVSVESAGSNTRPWIAQAMAVVVCFHTLAVDVVLFMAVAKSDDPLQTLTNAWPILLANVAAPVAIVNAFFGLRSRDKHARYAASQGQDIASVTGGIVQTFIRATRK